MFLLPNISCILFYFEHSFLNWYCVPVSVVGVSVLAGRPSALLLDVQKLFPHVNVVRVALHGMESSTCLFLLYKLGVFFVILSLISGDWGGNSLGISTILTLAFVVGPYLFFYSIKISSWVNWLIICSAVVDTSGTDCWYLSSIWFCWALWASSESSPLAIFWENDVDCQFEHIL